MNNNSSRRQSIVLIGSNGIIGNAIVKSLSIEGHSLFLGDISKDPRNLPHSCRYKQVDVMSEPSLADFFASAAEFCGHIDAVLPLAYPKPKSWGKKLEQLDSSSITTNLDAQLGSTIVTVRYAIEVFMKQGVGNLVLFSSIQGVAAPKFNHYDGTDMSCPIEYVASKSAIIAITRYLAKLYGKTGLRVNCVSPGGVLNGQDPLFVERYNRDCLSQGMLNHDDLNGLIKFLLSDESRLINGQNIIIDDGWSL